MGGLRYNDIKAYTVQLELHKGRSSITSAGFPKYWTPLDPQLTLFADVTLEQKGSCLMSYTTCFILS